MGLQPLKVGRPIQPGPNKLSILGGSGCGFCGVIFAPPFEGSCDVSAVSQSASSFGTGVFAGMFSSATLQEPDTLPAV